MLRIETGSRRTAKTLRPGINSVAKPAETDSLGRNRQVFRWVPSWKTALVLRASALP